MAESADQGTDWKLKGKAKGIEMGIQLDAIVIFLQCSPTLPCPTPVAWASLIIIPRPHPWSCWHSPGNYHPAGFLPHHLRCPLAMGRIILLAVWFSAWSEHRAGAIYSENTWPCLQLFLSILLSHLLSAPFPLSDVSQPHRLFPLGTQDVDRGSSPTLHPVLWASLSISGSGLYVFSMIAFPLSFECEINLHRNISSWEMNSFNLNTCKPEENTGVKESTKCHLQTKFLIRAGWTTDLTVCLKCRSKKKKKNLSVLCIGFFFMIFFSLSSWYVVFL